jgi:uncharacterized membrane protein (UPF0127 family)
MKKKILLTYRGQKVQVELKVVPKLLHGLGLMFSFKKFAKPRLFEFRKETNVAIHSWFVFYDFVAIWFDSNGKIIEARRIKPFNFNIYPRQKFKKLVEIPVNSDYDEVCRLIVGN